MHEGQVEEVRSDRLGLAVEAPLEGGSAMGGPAVGGEAVGGVR